MAHQIVDHQEASSPSNYCHDLDQPTHADDSARETLRDIWSDVLDLDIEDIHDTSNFFQLGGDSLATAQLVVLAGRKGLKLSRQCIFSTPVLNDLAKCSISTPSSPKVSDVSSISLRPFALAGADDTALRRLAAEQCGVAVSDIEDIYPATPLQAGLMSRSLRVPGAYLSSWLIRVTTPFAATDVAQCVSRVVRKLPILRTSFVPSDDHGFMQVVLSIPFKVGVVHLRAINEMDPDARRPEMVLGSSLTKFEVITTENPGDVWLLWHAHHATYDMASVDLVLRHLANSMSNSEPLPTPPNYASFVQYTMRICDQQHSWQGFWRARLSGVHEPLFPYTVDQRPTSHCTDRQYRHVIQRPHSKSPFTTPNIFRAAWAFLLGSYEHSGDVVFGAIGGGRYAPIDGCSEMVGPAIATTPVRTRVSLDMTVAQLLHDVTMEALEICNFEQVGLANIQSLGPDPAKACDFRTLVNVQVDDARDSSDCFTIDEKEKPESLDYPLVLELFSRDKDRLRLHVSYDSSILGPEQVAQIAFQLERVVQAFSTSPDELLGSIEIGPVSSHQTDRPTTPLIGRAVGELYRHAAVECGVDEGRIAGVWPCTPVEEEAYRQGQAEACNFQIILDIGKTHQQVSVLAMLGQLVAKTPQLRKRLFPIPSPKRLETHEDLSTSLSMCQTIITGGIAPLNSDDLELTSRRDRQHIFTFGQPLIRIALIHEQNQSSLRHVIITLAAAICDETSIHALLNELDNMVDDNHDQISGVPVFSAKSASHCVKSQDESFWGEALGSFSGYSFLEVPMGHCPSATANVSGTWQLPNFSPGHATPASAIFELCWALTLGVYQQSDDITFGVVRQCTPDDSDLLDVARTALLPQRIEFGDSNTTIRHLLNTVGACQTSLEPYSGISIETISGISGGCKAACTFQTVVKVRQLPRTEHAVGIISQAAEIREPIARHAVEVDVVLRQSSAVVTMRYDPSLMEETQANRLMSHYRHVYGQVCASCDEPGVSISDIDHTPKEHLEQLMEWNQNVEEPLDRRVHDLFEERVADRPYDAAVCARDGQWTYCELNDVAEKLARLLRQMGLRPGMLVPLLFEKCGLTIVAMLAVLKAGGANVALDPTHPPQRLQALIKGIDHPFILCSAENQALAVQLGSPTFALTPKTMEKVSERPRGLDMSKEITFDSTVTAFVLFTSGSTGTPKGILIPHHAFSSSIRGHSEALRFSTGIGSRNFQFTAYTSDVSIGEIFTSLAVGSCVCVPSDWDRKNDIAGAINDLRANWAFFTPSVATLLQPSEVPALRTMVFGGETASQQNFDTWGPALHLINSFGPAECSIWTHCMPRRVQPGDIGSNIGFSLGDATWITDPSDYNRLLPIGAVGEMLIEGPNVASGYLNEPEKTAKTFARDPSWATTVGRKSTRLYRTGDLARFLPNGMVQFLGRNDHQVKLNGLRVELGEVEHQIRRHVPDDLLVAVDVITPYPPGSPRMLAAFIAPRTGGKSADYHVRPANASASPVENDTSTLILSRNARVSRAIKQLHSPLGSVLPSHMVPKAYISLCDMPLTASAKTDRKQLKLFASMLSAEEIGNLDFDVSAERAPTAIMELVIAKLWSQALGRSLSPGVKSNFFKIGGNSLSAMKLVSLARKDGIRLTVEDIFQHPTLEDLADAAAQPSKQGDVDTLNSNHLPQDIPPFSILQSSKDTQIGLVATSDQLMVDEDDIEDLYPCSPLQEGLMALSQDSRGSYVAQIAFDLPDDLDVHRFKAAWDVVLREWPILRTRFFHSTADGASSRLMQVVTKSTPTWLEATDLDGYLIDDRSEKIRLGDPMVRLAIVGPSESNSRQFVLTSHHAVYDGWMLVLLLSAVRRSYSALPPQPIIPYNAFVKHLEDKSSDRSRIFWREYLRDASRTCWPELPTPDFRPQSTNRREKVRTQPLGGFHGFTFATIARVAFGLLLGAYAHGTDVIYASTVHGRVLGEFSAELVGGPTLATVPVRIMLDRSQSIQALLTQTQIESAQMLEHEQEGMQNIRRHNLSALASIDAQSLLVVQVDPPQSDTTIGAGSLMRERQDSVQSNGFLGSALVIEAAHTDDDMRLTATFDDRVVPARQAERFLAQMHHVIDQLCNNHQQTVAELDLVPEEEVQEMYSWNTSVPPPQETLIHELVKTRALAQPTVEALVSFEGSVTFKELDEWSDRLAGHLWSHLGLRSGTNVPLLFEKSLWTVVAMMAVLKIGAAYAALNPEHPPSRLRTLVEDIDADFVLCSEMHRSLAGDICNRHFSIGPSTCVDDLDGKNGAQQISPRDTAFLLFTSGSTGKPKAIMIDHTAFTSSIKGHAETLCYRRGSRNLQFTAYTSDVSMGEIFTSLSQGATVCIPSDEERMNDLASAMERMRVDWAFLTPSLASLLNADSVPTLKTLVFGGETASVSNVQTWAPRVHLINSFGPAETSIWCHAHPHFTTQDDGSDIGWSMGCATWIVDPEDYTKLMPIGTIGELVVEGPNVAAGYYRNLEKTQAAFVKHLAFSPSDKRSRVYRLGDLARWLPDGRVQFLGRKDGQVKLHGQRIEVGEVEHHVRATLSQDQHEPEVAVEMIRNPRELGDSRLVAFISCAAAGVPQDRANASIVEDRIVLDKFKETITTIKERLAKQLARHMVPTFFVPVSSMPLSASAKIDRNCLRGLIHHMDFAQLSDFAASAQKSIQLPQTTMQKTLRNLWCSVLGVEHDQVGIDDDFFQLGGDSISAMKLSSLARSARLTLAVQEIYDNPVLARLASLLETASDRGDTTSREIKPFSLLGPRSVESLDALVLSVAEKCSVDPCDVTDVYPCASTQLALVKRTLERNGAFWLYNVFEIPDGLDVDRLEAAWDRVVDTNEILRARILESDGRWLQAVVRSHAPAIHATTARVGEFCTSDRNAPFSLGQQLYRAAFVKEDQTLAERPAKRYFVLALHHALYDVPTLTRIFASLEEEYADSHADKPNSALGQHSGAYKHFINAVMEHDHALSAEFWKRYLVGVKANHYVPPPLRGCINRALRHRITLPRSSERQRTPNSKAVSAATIVYGALGLAFHHHRRSEDVILKLVSMGRTSLPLPTIQEIVGPTMTFVPLRINMAAAAARQATRIEAYLQDVAAQASRVTPFEHFGYDAISQVHADAAAACAGAVQVVVHPAELYGKQVCGSLGLRRKPLSPFSGDVSPLSVDVSMDVDRGALTGLDVRMVYDEGVVPQANVRALLADFDVIVRRVAGALADPGAGVAVEGVLEGCGGGDGGQGRQDEVGDAFVVECVEDQYDF